MISQWTRQHTKHDAMEIIGKAGIPAERIRHALAVLHNAEGRIRYDDKGNPGMHFQRDGYEEVVPLDKGVAEWAKSDEEIGRAHV